MEAYQKFIEDSEKDLRDTEVDLEKLKKELEKEKVLSNALQRDFDIN